MTNILRDVRFGVRLLRRNPGFAAVAILALALGIGATTAIFSVVYATLLAPLPYPQPDQLVMVWSRVQGNRNVSAAGTYLEWKRLSTAFQSLNAWTGGSRQSRDVGSARAGIGGNDDARIPVDDRHTDGAGPGLP